VRVSRIVPGTKSKKSMQRLMFAKIELWVVLFCAVPCFVATIFFDHLVPGAERKDGRYGNLAAIAPDVAEVPHGLGQLPRPDLRPAVTNSQAFDGRAAGWYFPAGAPSQGLDGYILFSRHDGAEMRNVIELPDLASWRPDPGALPDGVVRETPHADSANRNVTHFREIHPWMSQLDVDILDDHRVAVYDFRDDSVSHPFADLMKTEGVRTNAAGLFTELPGGRAMIEDVTEPRFILADCVNRGPNGIVYQLGRSRYVDRAHGDHAL
jgi:hypothetical protein